MREIPEEVLFDTRLIERYIASGELTRKEVDERLAKIPDASDLGEQLEVNEPLGADDMGTGGSDAPIDEQA